MFMINCIDVLHNIITKIQIILNEFFNYEILQVKFNTFCNYENLEFV